MTRLDALIPSLALCFAAGCIVVPARPAPGPPGPPPAAPPPAAPPPAAPPPAEAGLIDIDCAVTAGRIKARRELGDTVQLRCPPGCGGSSGATWGTDVYTSDSVICRAAVHAGAAPSGGGVVTIHLEPGQPAYRGTTRNGVQSWDYASCGASYRFLGVSGAPTLATNDPQAIQAGCSFTAGQIHGEVGSAHRIVCPAGCAKVGVTWGSDVYTGDSPICRAAIHAGLITDDGGEVAVILEPGRPAYRGTLRNGIRTSDYGRYAASYRFQR